MRNTKQKYCHFVTGFLLWSNRLKHLLPPETNHRIRKDSEGRFTFRAGGTLQCKKHLLSQVLFACNNRLKLLLLKPKRIILTYQIHRPHWFPCLFCQQRFMNGLFWVILHTLKKALLHSDTSCCNNREAVFGIRVLPKTFLTTHSKMYNDYL